MKMKMELIEQWVWDQRYPSESAADFFVRGEMLTALVLILDRNGEWRKSRHCDDCRRTDENLMMKTKTKTNREEGEIIKAHPPKCSRAHHTNPVEVGPLTHIHLGLLYSSKQRGPFDESSGLGFTSTYLLMSFLCGFFIKKKKKICLLFQNFQFLMLACTLFES